MFLEVLHAPTLNLCYFSPCEYHFSPCEFLAVSDYVWGNSETKFFFELSPDSVLKAMERAGYQTTGRCLTLNSMENRVYDVELQLDEHSKNPSDRFKVLKFYRPGRWTKEQILEEHGFLLELAGQEIPVIAPETGDAGNSLFLDEGTGIYYAIFAKRGGRAPDELDEEKLAWIARAIARIHLQGETKSAEHRIRLHTDTYGYANMDFLVDKQLIPMELESRYIELAENISDTIVDWVDEAECIRLHGDCHLGNILWRDSGPLFLDFDDMVMGPPIQDLWLLVGERDGERAEKQWETLIKNYETFRPFDHESRRLVEPLRALRFMHFSAWIGKRWQDLAFQQAFPYYGSFEYWEEQVRDLEEQWKRIEALPKSNATI